ncbi:hypothetical protein D9758_004818 [Tetrapyrgos nigripes]|uniref:Uncharacterized protein n=1 Tax=Tetrapyrgos nigripes TaxID=182062 RepID=A0A8H5G6A6_9AGAR|nr:hypothetical protein D9758_004818 [Tetrapyrgos nigripes]
MNPASYPGGPAPTQVNHQHQNTTLPPHLAFSNQWQAIQIVSNVANTYKAENAALRADNQRLHNDVQQLNQQISQSNETCSVWSNENLKLYEDNTRLNGKIKKLQETVETLQLEQDGLKSKLSQSTEERYVLLWNDFLKLRNGYNQLHAHASYYKSFVDEGVQRGIIQPNTHQNPSAQPVPPVVPSPTRPSQSHASQLHTLPTSVQSHMQQAQHQQRVSNVPINSGPQPPLHPNQMPPSARPNLHLVTQVSSANTYPQPPQPTRYPAIPHPPPPTQQYPAHVSQHPNVPTHHYPAHASQLTPITPNSGHNSPYHPEPHVQTSPSHVAPMNMLPTPHMPVHIPQYVHTHQFPQRPLQDPNRLPHESPRDEKNHIPPPTPISQKYPTPPISESHTSMSPETSWSSVSVKRSDSPVPVVGPPVPSLQPKSESNSTREFSPTNVSGQKRPSMSFESRESHSPKRPRLSVEGLDRGDPGLSKEMKEDPALAYQPKAVEHTSLAFSSQQLGSQQTTEQNASLEPVDAPSRVVQIAAVPPEQVDRMEVEPTLDSQEGAGDVQVATVPPEQVDVAEAEPNQDSQKGDTDSDGEPQRGPDGLYEELDAADWFLVGTAEDEGFGDDGLKICVLCRERVRNKKQVPPYQFVNPSNEEILTHFRTHHSTAFTMARREGPDL